MKILCCPSIKFVRLLPTTHLSDISVAWLLSCTTIRIYLMSVVRLLICPTMHLSDILVVRYLSCLTTHKSDHQSSTVSVIQLSSHPVVWLRVLPTYHLPNSNCSFVRLFSCPTSNLFDYSIVRLLVFLTTQLSDISVAQLPYGRKLTSDEIKVDLIKAWLINANFGVLKFTSI